MINKKLNNNGNRSIWDQNMGVCYRVGFDRNLNAWQMSVYMYMAKRTVGYMQSISTDLPATDVSKATGISINKTREIIRELIHIDLIKKISNNSEIGPKKAYKYQIVFKSGYNIILKAEEEIKEKSIEEIKEERINSIFE